MARPVTDHLVCLEWREIFRSAATAIVVHNHWLTKATQEMKNEEVTDRVLLELAAASQLHILAAARTKDGGRAARDEDIATLCLYRAAITDEGMKALSRLTNLRTLSLSDTELTDAGVKEISNLKNLNVLDLGAGQSHVQAA